VTTNTVDPVDPEVVQLRAALPAYTLTPLYLIMGVSAVDLASRSVLAVALDDIKAEFGVGDTALGVLGGAYFGLAILSGIPFGVLTDRTNRARIIAIGFVPWSIGMLLQSVAASFAVLVFARVLLGSIEASNGPSAQSLLGDYYPVQRRSRVLGIWRLGDVIGSSVGFAVAGVIATAFGWRWSFATFGLLGALCGLLVLRYLPEPPRGVADALHRAEQRAIGGDVPAKAAGERAAPDLSFRAAFRHLVRIRTAWVMVIAAGCSDFFFVGLGAWATSFFRRVHGVEASAAGAAMSLVLLTVIAGAIVGGRYSDRLLAEGRPADRIRFAALGYLGGWAAAAAAFTVDSYPAAVGLLGVAGFLIYLPIPALWTMWMDIIPAAMRGRAGSVSSILRAGFTASGPALIGVLSDVWDLRTAFQLVAPSLAISGLVLLLARRTYEPDAEAARAEAELAHV
jgi:MFS family permease